MLAAAGTRPKFDCSHDGWLQKAGERHNTILLQQCSFLATMPNTAGKGTHRLTSARGFGQKDAAGFRVCGLHPSNTHCTIGHAPSWYRHVLPVFRQDGVAWDDAPRPEETKTHLLKLAVGTALRTSLRTSRAPADRFESHARQLCASPILAPPGWF